MDKTKLFNYIYTKVGYKDNYCLEDCCFITTNSSDRLSCGLFDTELVGDGLGRVNLCKEIFN